MFTLFKSVEYPNINGELTRDFAQNIPASQLRNIPEEIDGTTITEIILENNFYHRKFNPAGGKKTHDYTSRKYRGCPVVMDNSTQLMWQQRTSKMWMNFFEAEMWIAELNEKHFAGFTNWRMPTIEEAFSLMEPPMNGEHKIINFINSIFDFITWTIWTSDIDKMNTDYAYVIDYGECSWSLHQFTETFFVRAVRNCD